MPKEIWAAELAMKYPEQRIIKKQNIFDKYFTALYKKKGSGRLITLELVADNVNDAIREAPLSAMFSVRGGVRKVYYLYGIS